MMEDDIQWLRELFAKSWVRHEPDMRRGRSWSEDLPINDGDYRKLLAILEDNREEFVFEPGSGVWGFGVSLSVYKVNWSTYPGVPDTLELIICVTGKQMFPKDSAAERKGSYAFVEGFTHTDFNRKAREEAGIKTKLQDMAYYDY